MNRLAFKLAVNVKGFNPTMDPLRIARIYVQTSSTLFFGPLGEIFEFYVNIVCVSMDRKDLSVGIVH